jgi:hypothetical protein
VSGDDIGRPGRRIVTGFDAEGASVILYDGPPQSIHHVTSTHVGALQMSHAATVPDVGNGQVGLVDLWRTAGLPSRGDPDPVAAPAPFLLEPEGTGFTVRYHVWGPYLDSSTMHATDTLDINIIISGEVTLFLEKNHSVLLQAGDTVILPGNNHGWRAGADGVSMIGIMQRLDPQVV